jgi:uncharacterized protein (TIGR00255 family)
MIKSMTGFGKGESTFENKTIVLEIRTLNSKNLDVNCRISNNYKDLESKFRKEISNTLKRGKIDFFIYHKSVDDKTEPKINFETVEDYISQLKKLSLNNDSDLLSIAMKLPGVMKTEKETLSDGEKKVVLKLFKNALKEVIDFRNQEGEIIFKDFTNRLLVLESHIKILSKIDKNRIQSIKEKLKNSLKDLKINIDKNRFEQELIYYMEKYDITEEKVRLNNHINYFKETLNTDDSNGKKLGFISQEMGREINTIGSKANDFELQKIVVQMKDELEKIKEQLLNLL